MSKNSDFPLHVERTEETVEITKKVEKISATFPLTTILELLQNKFPEIPLESDITPIYSGAHAIGVEISWYEDKEQNND